METFIFGLLFGLMALPIIDSLTTIIITFFEMIKSYVAVTIARNNQKIEEVSTRPQRQIGFVLPEEEEEVEIDDL